MRKRKGNKKEQQKRAPHPAHLLQLGVLEVVANHELQHVKELAVGDVAVLVDVVDFESNCARVVVAAWRGGVRV